jgi:hypothetical protein
MSASYGSLPFVIGKVVKSPEPRRLEEKPSDQRQALLENGDSSAG